MTFLNENGVPKLKFWLLGAVGMIGMVALGLLFASFETISAGERGIVLVWGKPDRILLEGFQIVNPISSSIVKINVRTQVIEFDKQALGAASKDLQDVSMAVVVNYHQNSEKVDKIYQQYGINFEENVLNPMVRETVKSVASKYTAEELVTKRTEVSDLIGRILTESFAQKNAIMEKFNIVNFNFSSSFNDAIEAKVTAEQNALAAKNKLEQVKFEAEQRVSQAKGEAEAIKIQAQAIQQQGGAEYVNLKAVEKWDGVLPTTMIPSSVLPFINLQ